MGNSESKLISSILSEKNKVFPDLEIKKDLLCKNCNEKNVPENFQLSGMKICRNCYNIELDEEHKNIQNYLKNQEVPFEGNEIIKDKLYLGNRMSATLKDELKNRGITHILMIGYYLCELYPNDFQYGNIEIEDDERENIFKYFYTCINFIESSKICYVHCQAGISRSASIVIAYVMYKFKLNYDDAYEYVKDKRFYISPNLGFVLQLEDLHKVLQYCHYDMERFRKINKQLYAKNI